MVQVDPGVSFERTEVVGPTISGELARSGFLAVVLAMLAILFYIWWRFEWHFAVGAIATLVLDITKTIGFFALTGIDFNLTAIAALLTMIGYSVNDKVVVYDRMRENLRKYKSMPFSDLIDMSINQVLARCIFTSMATAFFAGADGDLGWRCGEELRLADDLRRHRRNDLVDLYRGADPAVPQPLVEGPRGNPRSGRFGQSLTRMRRRGDRPRRREFVKKSQHCRLATIGRPPLASYL